jgi:hypothetical protein
MRPLSLASVGISIGLATAAAAVLSAPAAFSPGYSLISTTAPPPPVPLTPNDRGYVRVEINSGSTGCSINAELVACQTSANNWPANPNGQHFHTASINAAGEFHWVDADLGALEGRITLGNQTYSAQGWTIVAASDGTTFTNGSTGHGMSVSDQSVRSF